MLNVCKIFLLLFFISCKQNLQQKEMERLLSSLNMSYGSYYNAAEDSLAVKLPSSKLNSNNDLEIVNGVPSQNQKGFCGDGIINGDNEHCDRNAMVFNECSELQGGIFGQLKCTQDCHFDITNCMTAATDSLLGGVSESCKCNCDPSLCQGACAGVTGTGETTCFYDCRRKNCTCQCGPRYNMAFNGANIQCRCLEGNCACSLDQVEALVETKDNFATNAVRISGH